MGFCDTLTFEQAVPELGIESGAAFQTKNLHQLNHEFVITAEGKLLQRLFRHEQPFYRYQVDRESGPPSQLYTLPTRVPIGDKLIGYHGDLLLWQRDTNDPTELVVRFTHGQLKWIRPVQQYPEDNRLLLLDQGAR
jgi:hypothetical protein